MFVGSASRKAPHSFLRSNQQQQASSTTMMAVLAPATRRRTPIVVRGLLALLVALLLVRHSDASWIFLGNGVSSSSSSSSTSTSTYTSTYSAQPTTTASSPKQRWGTAAPYRKPAPLSSFSFRLKSSSDAAQTATTTAPTTTPPAAASSSSSQQPTTTTTTTTTRRLPVQGDVVTINCKLVPQDNFVPEPLIDGVVLHSNDPPERLTFVLHGGNYLPGLHQVVSKLSMGESVRGVPLDAGWGERNPNLVATVSFEQVGVLDSTQIQVGVQLVLANGVTCSVTNVTHDTFTIDANPPLAGASYLADVTLANVEDGPTINALYEDTFVSSNENSSSSFSSSKTSRYDVAIVALGCFWGAELAYMREPGVVGTSVGYTQGSVTNPTYEQVCAGKTGHTEAVCVIYDPSIVTYDRLVQLALDRLGESKYLLNQVGNDRGTQYRHGIYYHTDAQRLVAERIIKSYGDDCCTECLPSQQFYLAEEYHQQYLLKGGQSARKGDDAVIRCYG